MRMCLFKIYFDYRTILWIVMSDAVKKISLKKVFFASWEYLKSNWRIMGLFALANYILMITGVYVLGGTEHPLFLLLLVVMYIFWGAFFRFYFDKKPYLLLKPFVRSLVPSVKVIFATVVVVFGVLLLPYIPLLLGVISETEMQSYVDEYLFFLQKYMQDSHLLDIVLNLALVLIMPLILYRPLLAWVAALMGRRGSLRVAWSKTKGNYWQFVLMALLMNIPLIVVNYVAEISWVWEALCLLVSSLLLVYYNLVIARIYEFFYLED